MIKCNLNQETGTRSFHPSLLCPLEMAKQGNSWETRTHSLRWYAKKVRMQHPICTPLSLRTIAMNLHFLLYAMQGAHLLMPPMRR